MEASVKVLVRVHTHIRECLNVDGSDRETCALEKRCAAQEMYVELYFAVYSVTENYFIKYLSRLTI